MYFCQSITCNTKIISEKKLLFFYYICILYMLYHIFRHIYELHIYYRCEIYIFLYTMDKYYTHLLTLCKTK